MSAKKEFRNGFDYFGHLHIKQEGKKKKTMHKAVKLYKEQEEKGYKLRLVNLNQSVRRGMLDYGVTKHGPKEKLVKK